MLSKDDSGFRYDFSALSKGRLRAYHNALHELEALQDSVELDDGDLELVSAAGNFTGMEQPKRDQDVRF